MSCEVAKFTITKGSDNTFVFTIKANGSTLPMEIDDVTPDTFDARLISLADGTEALSKPLTITDALGGQVTLIITEAEAADLLVSKGSATDRYYLRPTYKLIIDCSTTNNGDFIAKVPEVYVD